MENIIVEEIIVFAYCPFGGYRKWLRVVGRQLNIEHLIGRFSIVVWGIDSSGSCWME